MVYVHAPAYRRTSTETAKGLYPWSAGAATPIVGVPLGKCQTIRDRGAVTLCCDPISWFQPGGPRLIGNPSAFVLGLPNNGKSTLVRRMIIVLAAWGVLPWVLGDVKGEYVDLMRGLGGQVIRLGRGRGSLNVLDLGEAVIAARRIGGSVGAELLADAKARRHLGLESLLTVQAGTPPTQLEALLLSTALDILDRSHGVMSDVSAQSPTGRPPALPDLLRLITDPPVELKEAALWRESDERYWTATDSLRTTLAALTAGVGLGEVFAQQTTTPLRRDVPVVFDLSGVDQADRKLRSALLLSCWAAGFGQVAVSHALSDAGLEPARRYFVVLDELWDALRAGTGLVDRVDALGRLNRNEGLGTVMVSHTMDDLKALPTEEDRKKAAGLVERSGMLICAGLPPSEWPRLRSVMRWSQRELDELASWSTPPTWQSVPGQDTRPPGQGMFMVKVGGRPGIPFRLVLTDAERPVNNTDKRWSV